MTFRSGFVTIIGKPNAGKSTLLNALMGSKLVIVSPKAQTTRHRIFGILNGPEFQVVFSDTPGVIRPRYGLHKSMMWSVGQSLTDADLVLLLIDLSDTSGEEDLAEMIGGKKLPLLMVLNKSDLVKTELLEKRKAELTEKFKPESVIVISALKGDHVPDLQAAIIAHLPEGPQWFDPEQMSDRPERFFVAEIIREKLFLNLEEELPYSCEVTILAFKEGPDIDQISAEIHVEKQSHKGMVIGKGGAMIKKIGSEARTDIEKFLGKKIFLELYVRVSENWKDDPGKLRRFGYLPD